MRGEPASRIEDELRDDIARKLPLRFDVAPLLAELKKLPRDAFGPYTLGMDAWEGLAVWEEGRSIRQKNFAGTFAERPPLPVLAPLAPILDAFPGEKWRVRLARQKPRSHAPAHADWAFKDFAKSGYRIHIPLATSPSVYFLVNRQRIVMKPGEAWYINVCYPHEIYNLGKTVRTHLFLDLVPGARIHSLLAASARMPNAPTPATRREARLAAQRFEKMRVPVVAAPDKRALNVAWKLAALAELA